MLSYHRTGDMKSHRGPAPGTLDPGLRRDDTWGGEEASGVRLDPRLMARLAALLAGSRDPLVRNVARARELAREAVRLTGGRDPRR